MHAPWLDYKMATKRGERVDYKSLHNLTSVDLTSTTKKRKRNPVHQAKSYAIERLTSKRETYDLTKLLDWLVPDLSWISAGKLKWALVIKDSSLTKKLPGYTVVNMVEKAKRRRISRCYTGYIFTSNLSRGWEEIKKCRVFIAVWRPTKILACLLHWIQIALQ